MVAMPKPGSGPNIADSERNTVKVQIRCTPELADLVRRIAAERGLTLAEILETGALALNRGER